MDTNQLIKEAYNEVMQELTLGMDDSNVSQDDISLGDISTQLAQAKGELATILDRAAQEGIIKKGDKISILNKNEYIRKVGNLPQKIRQLQRQLEPSTTEEV